MLENLIWVSLIIIVLGFLFYIFYRYYERNKNKSIDGQSTIFHKIKFQYYILLYMLILGIAVSSFFYLHNHKLFEMQSLDDSVIVTKDFINTEIENNEYDRCIAFSNSININKLIDLEILSDEDGKTLLDSLSIWNKQSSYSVSFVQKDNSDYIRLLPLNSRGQKYLFKSNLPFSFDDLLELFVEATNFELTDEFLNGEDTGIFLTIINTYFDYFYAFILEIDNHIYYAYYDDGLVLLQ